MKNHKDRKKIEYINMVETKSPKPNIMKNCSKAFFVGGVICCVGQFITNMLMNFGVALNDAMGFTSIILIFLGAFLTGIDVYDTIGQFAGAGSIIPITGFANSIVSSAMEYKKEGYIMGVGAKMFTIAGPVIVYGVIASVIVGLVHLVIN